MKNFREQRPAKNATFRQGKSSKPSILKVDQPSELMKFLIEKLTDNSRESIKRVLKNRQVLVDGVVLTQFNHPLQKGQQVTVHWSAMPLEKSYQGMTILYEDEYLIVADKHAGLLTVATDNGDENTLYRQLSRHVKTQNPENKVFIVHRLDRDTSGVLVIAKSENIQESLQRDWHSTVTERTYLAIVEGKVRPSEGELRSYLKQTDSFLVYETQDEDEGQLAITRYRTMKANDRYSLLAIDLETGRKNQIRVQLKGVGHSIVGDKKYGSKINPIGRLALHAWVLAFHHPVTGNLMRFETRKPRKFSILI